VLRRTRARREGEEGGETFLILCIAFLSLSTVYSSIRVTRLVTALRSFLVPSYVY